MWLPKLEKDLLVCYYKKDEATHRWAFLNIREVKVDLDKFIEMIHYLRGTKAVLKIEKANEDLMERKLISSVRKGVGKEYGIVYVGLTIEGKDLGRKYNNFFDRIGLWCAAKEHQWLWFIITFFAGCLAKCLYDLFFMIIKSNK